MRQGADVMPQFGPSPKYLGWPKVKNIVSLLIRVDKVASISQRLPYWVSEVGRPSWSAWVKQQRDRRFWKMTESSRSLSMHAAPAVVSCIGSRQQRLIASFYLQRLPSAFFPSAKVDASLNCITKAAWATTRGRLKGKRRTVKKRNAAIRYARNHGVWVTFKRVSRCVRSFLKRKHARRVIRRDLRTSQLIDSSIYGEKNKTGQRSFLSALKPESDTKQPALRASQNREASHSGVVRLNKIACHPDRTQRQLYSL